MRFLRYCGEGFQTRHIHTPVIVITAHDERGTMERVRLLGAAAYLKKPVDWDELLPAIPAAIAQTITRSETSHTDE